jgi:hypothetical protein
MVLGYDQGCLERKNCEEIIWTTALQICLDFYR